MAIKVYFELDRMMGEGEGEGGGGGTSDLSWSPSLLLNTGGRRHCSCNPGFKNVDGEGEGKGGGGGG